MSLYDLIDAARWLFTDDFPPGTSHILAHSRDSGFWEIAPAGTSASSDVRSVVVLHDKLGVLDTEELAAYVGQLLGYPVELIWRVVLTGRVYSVRPAGG